MKLKNILIVVEDLERAKKFYHEIFGLNVILNGEGNVILTEGLVLQERSIWEEEISSEVIFKHNSSELYFEEKEIEAFVEELEKQYPDIKYITPLITLSWGQKIVRFYDPDGNLIEVRTPE